MFDTTNRAPGVVILESNPPGPIPGASTNVVAMIGQTANTKLASYTPIRVTNWTEFTRRTGRQPDQANPDLLDAYDAEANLPLPHAVRGFLDNGGGMVYVVPVPGTSPDYDQALHSLEALTDVSIVCAPGVTDAGTQGKIIGHCAAMKYRFAILDGVLPAPAAPQGGQNGDPPADAPKDPVDAVIKAAPGMSATNAFGAVYWPWLQVVPPPTAKDQSPRTMPPSGHVAGVYARSDVNRGVHKAPANEPVNGVLDVSHRVTEGEHGILNENHVNAIRLYPNRAPMVFGARTRADEANNLAWRYVNVRRLLSYIEHSIVDGIQWAIFEPNNTGLWKSLDRTITEFLTRVWQSGALFGTTAPEAFYVKIDDELNPPSEMANGKLTIEIGVAPVKPAEYVIIRIGQWDGGSAVSEG